MFIAIEGPDKTGKSTLINNLVKNMPDLFTKSLINFPSYKSDIEEIKKRGWYDCIDETIYPRMKELATKFLDDKSECTINDFLEYNFLQFTDKYTGCDIIKKQEEDKDFEERIILVDRYTMSQIVYSVSFYLNYVERKTNSGFIPSISSIDASTFAANCLGIASMLPRPDFTILLINDEGFDSEESEDDSNLNFLDKKVDFRDFVFHEYISLGAACRDILGPIFTINVKDKDEEEVMSVAADIILGSISPTGV